jgi:chromosomal replication initiator protein
MQSFWQDCSRVLERELSPQQFAAWIKPLKAIDFDASTGDMHLCAPNRLKLDAIRAQFAARIQAVATTVLKRPVTVLIDLEDGAGPEAANDAAAEQGDGAAARHGSAEERDDGDLALHGGADPIEPRATAQHAATPVNLERARLNPQLTFDTFVTGKANQLARAAAMQVAENPGGSYNPLFLYGGVGLGKTHLIHAVGNAILARRPNAKVRYIHAEAYVSDVVRAYQRKAFDEFKRYYHSLDLLLIDDIQFFSGKSRTQEEFFYAFEALVAGRKQIIITSDIYLKELRDIEDRLVSRFASGLTVSIEPPELEMRVAILLKKAETESAELTEDVAFFIAKNLRSNVRELEGALRKVLAFAQFHGRVITVELAREALKDLLNASTGQVTVELIQKTVADYYKIKVSDMYSKRRPNNIAAPRQVAMYLAKEMTQKSLPEIGELFGGRDHTTVLHAVRKIGELRSKDAVLNHALHVLEQTLKG